MADDRGRKPIAGMPGPSERRHPTRLPILVCQRKSVPQVAGAVSSPPRSPHGRRAQSFQNADIPGLGGISSVITAASSLAHAASRCPSLGPQPVKLTMPVDGCSETWRTHPIGIFGLLGRGWGAVVGEV